MNKDIETAVNELKESLKSDELIKEYNALAQKISESTELNELEEKLKELQQQLVETLDKQLDELYKATKEQYELLKKTYEEHPLIANYRIAKEEVNELLKKVNQTLEGI